MFRTVRQDIKRIVALILTVAMVLPMNVTEVKAASGTWSGNDSDYTKLTAHNSVYYRADGTTPNDNPDVHTFGYYLNKYKYFRVREYTEVVVEDGESKNKTWPDYSQIMTEDFRNNTNGESSTKLVIGGIEPSESVYPYLSDIKNWTELSLFENVTDLTITGVQNIEQIAFPAPNAEKNTTGIKKLTIQNCEFDGLLDLSAYTNLEELVITNTTLKRDNEEIEGLDTLKKLKKIQLDGTNIYSVKLFNTENENVESEGLIFSAIQCESLVNVDTGNYMLINGFDTNGTQYAPSFKDCAVLENLTVKGIADKPNKDDKPGQKFNINGCTALNHFNISYYFADASYRLSIDASGVDANDAASEENASFSRIANGGTESKNGLYVLKAEKNSFLSDYMSNNSALFDSGSSTEAGKVKQILFLQDAVRYTCSGLKFWTTGAQSSLRDYGANPIVLRVGETIENNTPLFYEEDGTLIGGLLKAKYTNGTTEEWELTNDTFSTNNYTVTKYEGKKVKDENGEVVNDENGEPKREIGKIPTELSASQEESYNVITFENTRALKVTAVNPGVAWLEVKTKGEGSVSALQQIIVLDSIESIELDQTDRNNVKYYECDYDTVGLDSTGRIYSHTFFAKYKTKYPSLSKYTDIVPEWYLFRKSEFSISGFAQVHETTQDGISICTSAMSSKDGKYDDDNETSLIEADGTLNRRYEVIIKGNATGGEYGIMGKVCANASKPDDQKAMSEDDTDPWKSRSKFTLQNFSFSKYYDNGNNVVKGRDQIGDGFEGGNDECYKKSIVEFELSPSSNLRSEPAIVVEQLGDDNDNARITALANELMEFAESTDGYDGKIYTLKYKDGVTTKQKAELLSELSKNNYEDCYITVKASLGKIGGESKTYRRKVKLAGNYTIQYDANGGSYTPEIRGYYRIPLNHSDYNVNVYNKKSEQQLELKPATRDGYDFVKWVDVSGGSDGDDSEKAAVTKISSLEQGTIGDLKLKAIWDDPLSGEKYKVTFDANGGGDITDTIPVKVDKMYALFGKIPTPYYAGYSFKGWYTEKTGGVKIEKDTRVTIASDHTLYAHWELKSTRKVEAPEFSVESGEVKKGKRVKITSKTNGARIFYTVDGSDLDPDSDYSPETITEPIHYYEEPVVINSNCTIKAIAVKAEYNNSDVTSATYTLIDESNEWGDITDESGDKNLYKEGDTPDANKVPDIIWVAGVSNKDYTGSAITFPGLRVYKYKKILTPGTDYTVKYTNNVKAGTATITVTGKGNYSGTIVKNFTIKQLDISSTAKADNIYLAYNKRVQKGTTPVTFDLNGKTVTLRANTDFTFVYPETGQDAYKEPGTYEVQIVGKGNYKGTKTIHEKIVDIPLISKLTIKNVANKTYTGSPIEQNTLEVWNGRTQLTKDTDYTVTYNNNTDIGTASVTITGNGTTCDGSKTVTFKITGESLGKAAFGKEVTSSYPYTGSAIKPVVADKTDPDASLTIVRNNVKQALNGIEKAAYETKNATEKRAFDYTYEYVGDTTNIGTVKVVFTGVNGYYGTVSKNYKIVVNPATGVDISKMTITYNTDWTYDGTAKEPEVKISPKGTQPTEGNKLPDTNYTVSYANNTNAGRNATIIITGINACTGTVKKTFTIKQKAVTDFAVSVNDNNPAVYRKGGVKPEVTVKDGAKTLTAGIDYTVSYSNNSAVHDGTGTTKVPTVKITGKGNYTGNKTASFAITQSSLNNATITVGDITYQYKAGICKPVIKVVDKDGKILSAGTDYEKNIVYKYNDETMVHQFLDAKKKTVKRVYRAAGEVVNANDIISVGTEINATITGKGNYPGSKTILFRYISADISKASVTITPQLYTGSEIKLNKDDITVKIGKETLKKTDYEIAGYDNNIKKGSALVSIRGIGDYSGTKTAKFNIIAKTMNYTVIYDNNDEWMSENKNALPSTGKMNNSSTPFGAKLSGNSYKRPGYVFAKSWNTKPDGSGESFSELGKYAFMLTDTEYGKTVRIYAQWTPETYKITYNGAVENKNGVTENDNPDTYTYNNKDDDATIILKDPVRTGYTFGGWYLDSRYTETKKITSIEKGSMGNKVLYAKWTKSN